MYNEELLHMSKMLQKAISFSLKVQMVLGKMNSYLNIPVFSLICMYNIKNEKLINNNNYCMPHTHISSREWEWTAVALHRLWK